MGLAQGEAGTRRPAGVLAPREEGPDPLPTHDAWV